jgi:putative transposase
VASELGRDKRLDLVEWNHPEISLKKQAELLNLNRSSLYYRPVPPPPEEIAIKHRIDEIYTEYPFYGSRRITVQLRREGFSRTAKPFSAPCGKWASPHLSPIELGKTHREHRVYPYLLRGLSITHPNQVWGIDITSIRLSEDGWSW